MTIYLIGPSGVGKTRCGRYAAAVLRAEYRDLDTLCKGDEFNWVICRQALDTIEDEARMSQLFYIVDIGAGTQCVPDLQHYLMSRRQRVVLIYAPASEVIRRNPLGPGRSPGEYEHTKYISRQALYQTAMHVVNVSGKSEETAKSEFADYVARALSVPARATRTDD